MPWKNANFDKALCSTAILNIAPDHSLVWGKKHLFKVQATTSEKHMAYFQMNVCKTLARSVKPRHERIGVALDASC